MREELDKKLCEKYPEIFRDRHASMTETAMCWGFDCGDGWYDIIDALCANIKNYIWNNHRSVESYEKHMKDRERAAQGDFSFLVDKHWTQEWYDNNPGRLEERKQEYLDPLPEWHHWVKNPPVKMGEVVATQVKEKFGTLRFYYNGGDKYIDGVVAMAESMSAVTCEVCGSPGKTVGGGWIRTLCETHTLKKELELGDN